MFSGTDLEIKTNVYIDKSSENFDIYPNPLSSKLLIKNQNNKKGNLTIFDSLGKNVLSLNSIENEINVQYLTPGIYFVKILFQNGVSLTKKFLKE